MYSGYIVSAPPRVGSSGRRTFRSELAQKLVGARQVIRHDALRPLDLDDGLTRIRRDQLMRIERPVRRAYKRFSEIHRIVDDRDERERLAVPDEVFGEHRLIAARDAVAPNPSHLQVRRRDGEHVALPLARRKPLPRVRGVSGGCGRPSIQIVRSGCCHEMCV